MMKKILTGLLLVIAAFLLYITVFRKSEIVSSEYIRSRYALPYSHFMDWKGVKIHYTDRGTGTPVIMIHGLGGSSYDFAALDSLMHDQYRLIRIDLPGFGLSDFPNTEEKDPDFSRIYQQCFQTLIDTLKIDSFYVMGNSMGGMMAWDLAVLYPQQVKKLVLLSSAGYDMQEVQARVTKVMRHQWLNVLLRKGIPEWLIKSRLKYIFYNQNIFTEQKVARTHDFWNKEGGMKVIMELAVSQKYLDTALIKQVQCPTLILWGKQDHLVPPEYAYRFHRDIKNSSLIVYDSCGHAPMIERPLDVKRDVEAFFKSAN